MDFLDPKSIRDKICIVGVGNTKYGNFPETDAYGLGAEALKNALDDAGLRLSDLDGLVVNRIPSYERFSEMIGLKNQRFGFQLPAAGRMSALSVMLAAAALLTGQASYVGLVYGNNGRSVRDYYGGGDSLWSPWGFTSPGARHAMMFRRHMHLYGTTSEQLAHVGVTFRKHASLNPNAVMQKPYTVEDHQNSRFICEPLRLLDYCLINDGGVALIMTTADRARHLKKPPVYIRAMARADTYTDTSFYTPLDDFWYDALQQVAREIYPAAGISRDEVNALMIYDNFSPTVLFSLEGMGFCPRGESGPFVADGNLGLDGRCPTNTSGGHLSESYMQGWALIVEAVRQLRGECGARQVKNCEVVQYICATPIATSIIFRR
ncbi:MAG: lipid-transfer protein [Paenibacillaceae bacterium ZCTH02-B3]|nr:MAG: lipid-transfer protein [Paenibacillaceae bacterium ZCTH02-B3]